MNNSQRRAVTIALIIAGAVLSYMMTAVDTNTRSPIFGTVIYSWETKASYPERNFRGETTWMPAIKTYLYIGHGIVGVLLGLVVPLLCWAAAVYIALGTSRFDTPTIK